MATAHLRLVETRRRAAEMRSLIEGASLREKALEHVFLGQLGMEFLARGVDYEVLHAEADRYGYDVVLEAGGIMRHVQLKVTIMNGARAGINVHTRLPAR